MSFVKRTGKDHNERVDAANIPPLGELIRFIRKANQISQVKLAKKMTALRAAHDADDASDEKEPIEQSYISKVEGGCYIKEKRAQLFVEALGGPADIPNPYAWLTLEYLHLKKEKEIQI